jgi:hypothetical protein
MEIVPIMELSVTRIDEMYPSLALFGEITGRTLTGMIGSLLANGVEPSLIQSIINSDQFVTMLAGSVFCRIQDNPTFGCDSREDYP